MSNSYCKALLSKIIMIWTSHNKKIRHIEPWIGFFRVKVVFHIFAVARCCPRPRQGSGYWTGPGSMGNASNGLSIHSHKSR